MKKILLAAALAGAFVLAAAEKIRIVDATFSGAEPVRALALGQALKTGAEIRIDRMSPHAALQELFHRRADFILIEADRIPRQNLYRVRPYAAAVLALYANVGNPVRNATPKQLRELLTAERPLWCMLPRGKYGTVHRIALKTDADCGLEQFLLKKEKAAAEILRVGTSGEGVLLAGADPEALFAGLLLPEVPANVRTLTLSGVEPTVKNAVTGKYPLARIFCVMSPKNPAPGAAALLERLRSRDFRDAVFKAGLLPADE